MSVAFRKIPQSPNKSANISMEEDVVMPTMEYNLNEEVRRDSFTEDVWYQNMPQKELVEELTSTSIQPAAAGRPCGLKPRSSWGTEATKSQQQADRSHVTGKWTWFCLAVSLFCVFRISGRGVIYRLRFVRVQKMTIKYARFVMLC